MASQSIVQGIQDCFNVSGFFNPFKIVNGGSYSFVKDLVGELRPYSLAIVALMFAMALLNHFMDELDGEDESPSLLPIIVEFSIIIGIIASYNTVINLLPQIFHYTGQVLYKWAGGGLGFQFADILSSVGEEGSTDFKFFTSKASEAPAISVFSAILSVFAMLMAALLSFIQPFIYAIWYTLGIMFVPMYVFKPFRQFFWNWFYSLIAVSLWGVPATIFSIILAKNSIIRDSYLNGASGGYIESMMLSLIVIISYVSIPSLCDDLTGGTSFSIKRMARSSTKITSAGARAASYAGRSVKNVGRLMQKAGSNSRLAMATSKAGKGFELAGNYVNPMKKA